MLGYCELIFLAVQIIKKWLENTYSMLPFFTVYILKWRIIHSVRYYVSDCSSRFENII